MFKSKAMLAVVGAVMLAVSAPAMAGMSGIEWMQKWQQLEKKKAQVPQGASAAVDVNVRVVKVDIPARQLTISHGAVKRIAMPAMSMTFPVADTTHLRMLNKGDRVNIHVVNEAGTATVTGFKMQH